MVRPLFVVCVFLSAAASVVFSGTRGATASVSSVVPTTGVRERGFIGSWPPCTFDTADGSCHGGIDISGGTAKPGNAVYAFAAGTVIQAGGGNNFGCSVTIDHGDQGGGIHLFSLYAHMGNGDGDAKTGEACQGPCPSTSCYVDVSVGQSVGKGQKIGNQGDSGFASGVHLHFSLTTGTSFDYAKAFDPSTCIGSPSQYTALQAGSPCGPGQGNTTTVTDIPNPDSYSCSQPGFVNFESFPDGTNLSSGSVAGVHFTTTNGYTWLVGDFATGYYNGKYPRGGYTSGGTHWAWLGESQGAGRIDFPAGRASYFSLLVSDYTPVYLDAYDGNGNILATAGPSPNNYATGHMTELKITRAVGDMAYVVIHDSGNYFEIDDVCTNAPGTPNTIKRVAAQTYFMQTGQQVQGNFIVDFVSGAKQFLHIFLGPFFSDVDLNLTRPDGSPVLPTDAGVTFTKTPNSIDVTINDAQPGTWQYQIVANQLDPGGENIDITADEETIVAPNAPPILTLSADQNVQYSDALSFGISCSDTDGDTLALGASGLPSGFTFTDNGDGTGTVSGTAQVAAGTYPVTFSCSDGVNPAVTGNLNITVTPENAAIKFWALDPTAVKVNAPGGAAGPLTIGADITEATDDTTNGNISFAVPVTYQLIPVGAGTTYTCTAATSGGGVGGTLGTSCTFSSVAVNVYDVHISIGGSYYQGSADSVLAVYDPSLGFVTGGGSIMHSGVLSNFGFNVKYLKSGQIQGSLLYIEHRPTGDVVLKSNAMGSLSIVGTTAYILGKATLNGVGNYGFMATVVDNGEPGTSDQFGLQLKDPSGVIVSDLTFSSITLSGGNIVVPHK